MLKILIVDDSAIFRIGIKQILSAEFGPLEATEAALSPGTLDLAAGPWHLAIVTVDAPGGGGRRFVATLRSIYPEHTVLTIASRWSIPQIKGVVRSTMLGPIAKEGPLEELIRAVRQAINCGEPSVAKEPHMASKPRGQARRTRKTALSERELDVLRLVAAGKSVKEIAALLGVGASTVGTYRVRLLRKLDLCSTAELIRYAFRRNLAD